MLPAAPLLALLAEAAAIAYRAYRVYEAAEDAKALLDMAKGIEEAKKRAKEVLEKIDLEVNEKTSTFARVDAGGNSTISRKGKEGQTYKTYIERKIPFRPALSLVCKTAMEMPIKVPRRILKKMGGQMVEQEIQIALRQTTASVMLEIIDHVLDWKSPVKAEPNYDKMKRTAYLGSPLTRPKRLGPDVFPFWPRPGNSVAPDVTIVEYRQRPFNILDQEGFKDNVFAFVEIKFPKDWVKDQQMMDYEFVLSGARNAESGRLALLRVPEDCMPRPEAQPGDEKKRTEPKKKEKGKI